MPKKSLQYLIFNELLIADDDWFEEDNEISTMERDEPYFDYLAERIARMLKKEKKL